MNLFTTSRTLALGLAVLAVPALAQDSRHGFYAAPALETIKPVAARSGMVVAQEKIAAGIGRDVLARGGVDEYRKVFGKDPK